MAFISASLSWSSRRRLLLLRRAGRCSSRFRYKVGVRSQMGSSWLRDREGGRRLAGLPLRSTPRASSRPGEKLYVLVRRCSLAGSDRCFFLEAARATDESAWLREGCCGVSAVVEPDPGPERERLLWLLRRNGHIAMAKARLQLCKKRIEKRY